MDEKPLLADRCVEQAWAMRSYSFLIRSALARFS